MRMSLSYKKENSTEKVIRENTCVVLYCSFQEKSACKWTRVFQTRVVQGLTVRVQMRESPYVVPASGEPL